MATVIVLFNLRDGADVAEYEKWARERDAPAVNALPSVSSFRVQKTFGILGSDAAPPYQYIEILEHAGLDALGADIAAEEMQKVAAEFQAFADNPIFLITEQSA